MRKKFSQEEIFVSESRKKTWKLMLKAVVNIALHENELLQKR